MKIWLKECDHYDDVDGDDDDDDDGDDDGDYGGDDDGDDDMITLCDDGKEKNTDQHH